MIEARAKKLNNGAWGIGVPAGTELATGQQVMKVTSRGNSVVTVGEFQGQNQYGDNLWTATENGGPAPTTGPSPSSPPAAPAGPPPASPNTSSSSSPSRLTASELLTVWKLVYGDLISTEGVGPEQASSGAGVVAIAVQRGVENDLDPFSG